MRFPAPFLTCLACAATLAAQPASAATATAFSTASIMQPITMPVSQTLVSGVTTLPIISAPAVGAIASAGTNSTASTGVGPERNILNRLSGVTGTFGASVGAIAQQIGSTTSQQVSFVIVGDGNRSVSIAIPSSVALSRLGGNGEQVLFRPVSTLATANAGQSRLTTGSDGNGSLAFGVGGQVNSNSGTAPGDYAGVLRITVQYN